MAIKSTVWEHQPSRVKRVPASKCKCIQFVEKYCHFLIVPIACDYNVVDTDEGGGIALD